MSNRQLTSITRLESVKTALMLSEDTLQTVIRDHGTPDEVKESTRGELQLCREHIALLTKRIALMERQLS
jgi:hypothetical protein